MRVTYDNRAERKKNKEKKYEDVQSQGADSNNIVILHYVSKDKQNIEITACLAAVLVQPEYIYTLIGPTLHIGKFLRFTLEYQTNFKGYMFA